MPGGRTDTQYFPMGGGLDVVTPALSMPPGRLLACANFEPWFSGGYRRIDGFERFDGRPRPHLQTFIGFDVSAVEDIALGITVTGAISGATGVVIGKYEDDGTFGSDTLAVTKVTGTFQNGEGLAGLPETDVDSLLLPNAAFVDTSSVVVSGAFADIDEGVDDAESISGLFRADDVPALRTIRDDMGAATVSIPMSAMDAGAVTVNSWTLAVRARVLRDGPETDDSVIYRLTFAPGADSQAIDFTEADVGAGWITRSLTQAGATATPADINAEAVVLSQAFFLQNGYASDGLRLEVDAIEITVSYNGPTVIRSAPVARYAPDSDTEDTFLEAAYEEYRGDIDVVPGEGPVRGAWRRKSNTFAFRDNIGATAGVMYLASASGWTTTGVTMGRVLHFSNGTDGADPDFILEGETITGATSGATGVVHRVIIHDGAPGANDAVGYLVFPSVTGAFTNGENLRIGANVVAVAVGSNSTYAFPPGGKYRFHNHNFFGGASTYNVYGCNAVGPAFEISESNVVTPILFPTTALDDQPANNTPFLIEEFRNHLFLALPGGTLVQSVIGEPTVINGFLGAAEFGIGAEITGLNAVVGSVLIVNTDDETRGLFGTDISDWELRLIGEKTGGKLYSAQKLDTIYALDDLGITSVSRTDAFGDFAGSTVSQMVQPIVDALRVNFTDATVVRKANQYRMYFDTNDCIIMYVPTPGGDSDRRSIGTPVGTQFGFASYPFPIKSIWNCSDEVGTERTFFATTDTSNQGYVFEDLVGTSFDGETIRSYIRSPFNFMKTPSYRKHFRRADLELSSSKPLTLQFISDLDFGAPGVSSIQSQIEVQSGGGFWDVDNWDEFFWDGQNIATARGELSGTGENIGLFIYNESAITRPFVLQGVTIHYDLRRLQR